MIQPVPPADPTHASSATPTAPVRDTYRQLCRAGFTAPEAGRLTAHLEGLGAVSSGWTIGELERLLFVRELVRTGRIGS